MKPKEILDHEYQQTHFVQNSLDHMNGLSIFRCSLSVWHQECKQNLRLKIRVTKFELAFQLHFSYELKRQTIRLNYFNIQTHVVFLSLNFPVNLHHLTLETYVSSPYNRCHHYLNLNLCNQNHQDLQRQIRSLLCDFHKHQYNLNQLNIHLLSVCLQHLLLVHQVIELRMCR